eukprot:jgi/Botrbrau1/17779/Bobra.0127s0032.1
MCTDEDPASYVVKLILQDQPPADNQELIEKSLQDLQSMAHMVTARVNHRIAEEQCRLEGILHRIQQLNSRLTDIEATSQSFRVTACAKYPETDSRHGWTPIFPSKHDLREGGPGEAVRGGGRGGGTDGGVAPRGQPGEPHAGAGKRAPLPLLHGVGRPPQPRLDPGASHSDTRKPELSSQPSHLLHRPPSLCRGGEAGGLGDCGTFIESGGGGPHAGRGFNGGDSRGRARALV